MRKFLTLAVCLLCFFTTANSQTSNQPKEQMITKMLASNRQTAPFQIRKGTSSEGVDLVAEWKVADAKWYEIFAKAKFEKTFLIFMNFDGTKKIVLAKDKMYEIEWRAGTPSFYSKSAFSGQIIEISSSTAVAFTEELSYGVVYKYKFNTNEIKDHLKKVLKENGWDYKTKAFGAI